MRAKYEASPEWLKALMNAWADGLNYYLYKHPQVKPRVIARFEPWMALTFTEGSIGGDIEKISLQQRILRQDSGEAGAGGRHTVCRAERIQRHRYRAIEHGGASCAVSDQSAYNVFLQGRSAHAQLRRFECKWVSVALMQEPVNALIQSYTRAKAKNYKEFRNTMELHTNSSNNTVYADADGNIAYFHSNFIPRRDTKLDWTKPVDGSDPATDWKGILSID